VNWSSVLGKSALLGSIYMLSVVGIAKVTTVLLSMLNEALAALDLAVVVVMFYILGVAMLIAMLPGSPVYVCGGVVLTSAVMGDETTDQRFCAGVALAICVCFVVKLTALVIQQKLIGGMLGKAVSIRRAVGINSMQIKAIRKILMAKGLSPMKIMILCGGPDWPTSVLTGIMDLPLLEMIIGEY
jgi:hypothetical protein